jgi:hypoxanthine phosphoribosyltransferase
MSKIKILDKTFEPFIGHEIIQAAIENIAQKLMEDYKDRTPLFLCVLSGSFIFSADLFKVYEGPAEISFIRLSSYKGTTTTEEVKTVIGLVEDITDRDLIILEDIIDSGITVSHLVHDLEKYQPRSIKIATLLLKPKALRTDIKPDYVGMEIPNDFIVGYGLDYDGFGRNLKDIYKIVE